MRAHHNAARLIGAPQLRAHSTNEGVNEQHPVDASERAAFARTHVIEIRLNLYVVLSRRLFELRVAFRFAKRLCFACVLAQINSVRSSGAQSDGGGGGRTACEGAAARMRKPLVIGGSRR